MKRSEIFLMVFQIPLDYFMLVLAGIVSYKLRFTDWAVNLKPVIFQLSLSEFINIIAFVALAWILIFIVSGLYNIDPNKKMSDTLVRIFMACSSGIAVVAIYIMFTQQLFDSRFLVATAWVFSILFIFASHLLMRGVKAVLYRRGIGLRRIVVVGKNGLSDQIIESLNKRKELGYNVISNFEHFAEDVISKLKKLKPEELIFINPRANEEESLKALQFCDENHIVFKYSADLFATYSTNMAVHPLVGVPIVEIKKTSLEGWGRVVKRIFDIILGGLVIVLVSPLMLLSALVI